MKDFAAVQTFSAGAFPNVLAINSTGAATPDGTEYIAEQINNSMFGWQQAFLDYAGLTPDGVIEAPGTSQILEAMQLGAALLPGLVLEWNLNVDPATIGFRGLLLQGQGVLRSNIPFLDQNCYVGDGNNAAVAVGGGSGLSRGAYYRADDAAGTIPNITGVYLIMPESRGYGVRGLDIAGTVDPQGTLRFLGDNQADAMQRITGNWRAPRVNNIGSVGVGTFETSLDLSLGGAAGGNPGLVVSFDNSGSTSPNPAKTDDFETRGAQRSTKYVVIY